MKRLKSTIKKLIPVGRKEKAKRIEKMKTGIAACLARIDKSEFKDILPQ